MDLLFYLCNNVKMQDLNSLRVFLEVVKTQSFSGAARALKIQKSTVSRKVADLEEELGVNLIRRTTRQVVITSIGREYFKKTQDHLTQLFQINQEISGQAVEPQGEIKISAPIDLGVTILPAPIAKFQKLYPKIKIDLRLEDRIVDLIGENIDVALRAGKLLDSNLKAKRLGVGQFGLYGSPQALKGKSLTHPNDLKKHQVITFTRPAGDFAWTLFRGSQKVRLQTNSNLRVNHLETIKEILKQGEAIAMLPSYLCRSELMMGELIHILPEWHGEKSEMSLVYSASPFLPVGVRLLIDFLQSELRL